MKTTAKLMIMLTIVVFTATSVLAVQGGKPQVETNEVDAPVEGDAQAEDPVVRPFDRVAALT